MGAQSARSVASGYVESINALESASKALAGSHALTMPCVSSCPSCVHLGSMAACVPTATLGAPFFGVDSVDAIFAEFVLLKSTHQKRYRLTRLFQFRTTAPSTTNQPTFCALTARPRFAPNVPPMVNIGTTRHNQRLPLQLNVELC